MESRINSRAVLVKSSSGVLLLNTFNDNSIWMLEGEALESLVKNWSNVKFKYAYIILRDKLVIISTTGDIEQTYLSNCLFTSLKLISVKMKDNVTNIQYYIDVCKTIFWAYKMFLSNWIIQKTSSLVKFNLLCLSNIQQKCYFIMIRILSLARRWYMLYNVILNKIWIMSVPIMRFKTEYF